MSQDRLLSDEELFSNVIDEHTDDVVDARIMFHKNKNFHAYQLRLKKANSKLYEAINTQKRLYAESVIGEDEPEDSDDYPFEYGKQYGRNELRNELRTKLAKWLNQPTVNQSASVSRSDEGGESTKGEEE